MKIKKDGHLVEPLDLDVDAKSQKTPKKKQKGSEEPSRKHPRSESDPKDLNEGNLLSAVETSRKGKGKVTESLHDPDVDTDVDIPAEDRRRLKIGMTANRLEMDPPLSTPTRQTSGRGNNHIPAGDTTKEVPLTSSKVPFDVILEEFISQMTTVLSNIIEHHGRKNQRLASLEQDLTHAKLDEEKLTATIEALEKEKSEMNARVALMGRKDLYDLLKAKMEGSQIANHPGTIGGFENLNLTITKKWVEIPMLNLEEFEKYDFSVDKFFSLQDPISPDDVQASPDFEEDLRTNQCLRLQAEVRNLESKPQRVTRSTRVRLDYEPTILPDVPPMDNPTRLVTLDLSVDARYARKPSSVDLRGKNHCSLAIIRLHNDATWLAHLDSSQGTHDPEAIFHVLKQVLWLIVPIDPALVMTGIMNVEQQQDGHSCGKHVLQMLVGAAMKESDGLDRCFREEGLRYIATLDQIRSFDMVFGMYLSGKLASPPM
ncbi:hypothetical protein R1flu_027493 [Riccia fluitans]|uniref:Ubiquitin-like protease family profile domain-containing protein n=1 Tax=Riccia fluitans TaxID=41844 RepID=A0ABD1XJH0_9MARC